MNPQNKKAINNEYSSSSKSQKAIEKFETKKKKMRYNQAKDTNKQIYQSQLQFQKRRNNFMVWKMQIVNLKKMKGKIDFWQKKEKQKVLNIKTIKKEKKMAGQRKIMMKFKRIKPEKILLI